MSAERANPSADGDGGRGRGRGRLMCEFCGYRTGIHWNLQVHRRRHTGEKPFSCHTCQASFPASYQLKSHLERHLEAAQRRQRHMCTDCNVGFSSSRALYHHRPLHEQAKRFKCSQCDKSFAQAAGYAQHKRMHRQRNQRVTRELKDTQIIQDQHQN